MPQASQRFCLEPALLDSVPQALPIIVMPLGRPPPAPPTSTAAEAIPTATSCSTTGEKSYAVASVAIFFQPQFCLQSYRHRPSSSDTHMNVLQRIAVACLTAGISAQPLPPRQVQPPAQPPPVPKQQPGYPFQIGGWNGNSPAENLLPGWWAKRDEGQWLFYRDGRHGIEAFYFTPRVIAAVECIPAGRYLHATSFPIIEGRWYPELEVLDFLCGHLVKDTKLLEWAFYEAGRVLDQERTHPRVLPLYMYPEGDKRPPQTAGQIRRLPAVKNPPAQPPTKTPLAGMRVDETTAEEAWLRYAARQDADHAKLLEKQSLQDQIETAARLTEALRAQWETQNQLHLLEENVAKQYQEAREAEQRRAAQVVAAPWRKQLPTPPLPSRPKPMPPLPARPRLTTKSPLGPKG